MENNEAVKIDFGMGKVNPFVQDVKAREIDDMVMRKEARRFVVSDHGFLYL